ncbi:succinyl-CoA ligase [GDP-forming] subunit beta, mitochondrial [Tachysurus ichikawai]
MDARTSLLDLQCPPVSGDGIAGSPEAARDPKADPISDREVEAILVNIFGGIVNCAIIAKGITKACTELELKVPLVVRLEGTNVQEAKRILSESGLPITSASNLDDAAKKAVAALTKK